MFACPQCGASLADAVIPKPSLWWLWWVIAAAFGLFGTVAVVGGLYRISKTSNAKDWPTAQGTIVKSEVQERSRSSSSGSGGSRSKTYHCAELRYRYAVGGHTFESEMMTPLSSSREHEHRETAESEAARYPEGAAVTVHHHPTDPSDAYLEYEAVEMLWLAPALGSVFLVVAIACTVLGWRAGRHAATVPAR
jgi:hypothetical protein